MLEVTTRETTEDSAGRAVASEVALREPVVIPALGHDVDVALGDLEALVVPRDGGASASSDRRTVPPTSEADRRRVPRTPRAHLFVTICHWSMTVLLAVALLTGMRLGWGYLEGPLAGLGEPWTALLGRISPKGTFLGVNLIILHVTSSFLMLLVAGVYVGYLIRSRTTARLQVNRADLRKLWTGIRSGQFLKSRPALWSANVLVYWGSFLFIAVLVLTGVALYRLDWGIAQALGGYSTTRLVHALLAYLLLPLVLLHAVLQWLFGRFWTIFKAVVHRPHVLAGLAAFGVMVPVVAGAYYWNGLPATLTVQRIAPGESPQLDGEATEAAWRDAGAVTIRTVKGVNNPHDYVDIEVKAVHDGQYVYFLFAWDDPDASFKRFPLQKTDKGWKVLQTAFERGDENVYYEDKLSAYFTDVPNRSCAASCHLGVGPHAERGEKHGVHYTAGETGDVWHWKAIRTNPMGGPGQPGYLDDMHFGPWRAPKGEERFTAGYHADPQPGGGYTYNFEKLDRQKRLADTYVRPKMLPPPGRPLTMSADATESDHDASWWILKAQGVPYTAAADTYPVGTLIPNILISPFQGDRADVRAQAR
jgi:hypothetical protein